MTELYTLNSLCTEKLPTPHQLREVLPIGLKQRRVVEGARETIVNILKNEDPRILLIAGPCSVHSTTEALEYARKLRALAEALSDTFFLIMRLHFEKPRTCTGWKGLLYDPLLDGSNDLLRGLRWTRELLLEMATLEIPIASELLGPTSVDYFGDLISLGSIGARTSSSQVHRQIASAQRMPIAFKNNTNGDIQVAVDGVRAAALPHTFFGIDAHGHTAAIRSQGNPHCCVVLRGGKSGPNYNEKGVKQACSLLTEADLPKKLLIDCSHDNSAYDHRNQFTVFQEVIKQIVRGDHKIAGIMLESYLEAGSQRLLSNPKLLLPGCSITDPCLDWQTTEEMLRWAHAELKPLAAQQPVLEQMSS